MLAADLTDPERQHDSRDGFSVDTGYLARGLGMTGPAGPLGSKEISADTGYSARTDINNEPDLANKLRMLLDAGLQVRYVVALRVMDFAPPSWDPVPPRYGSGALPEGGVTVDAFVIDLDQGDVPCQLRAQGTASGTVWTGELDSNVRMTLVRDISKTLSEIS